MFRAFILAGMILAPVVLGRCTTVIIKFDKDRILIAADTRRILVPNVGKQIMRDDKCKILVLDRTVMAMSGIPSYHSANLLSRAPGPWDAFSDARKAFGPAGIGLGDGASHWSYLLAHHFEDLNAYDPEWVSAQAATTSIHALAEAFFTRWENGSPALETRGIFLHSFSIMQPPTIARSKGQPPMKDGNASLNGITQELIDATTDRAKEAARRWLDESKKYPETEKPWRYLEFLIRETSKIDPRVSPQSDIIAIPREGEPYWIKRAACK